MKKTIIITGGSGNLGRFLIENYSRLNYIIYNISRQRPYELFKNEKFIKCNLSSFLSVKKALSKLKQKNRFYNFLFWK